MDRVAKTVKTQPLHTTLKINFKVVVMKNLMKTASEVKNSSRTSTLAHETRKNKNGLAMFVNTIKKGQGRMMKDGDGFSEKK